MFFSLTESVFFPRFCFSAFFTAFFCMQMVHVFHATACGLMGLAMRALAGGDDFDDSVYIYMRTLWMSYSLNADR